MTEKERFDSLYKSLCIDNKLIHAGLLLKRAAKIWPNNKIAICGDDSITYLELYHQAHVLSEKLKALGVKSSDRVIIIYENSIEFYIAYFAVWQSGAIVAPLNVFLHQKEIAHIIEDAQPSAIIVSKTQKEKFKDIPNLPKIIDQIVWDTKIENNFKEYETPKKDIDDTIAILYTSGTTGFPKGVMLSSKNIIINTIQGISRFDIRGTERIYCALPLFHSLPQNTCIWSNIVLGCTAIIVTKIDRKNLLSGFKHNPTIIVGVPALYGLFCLFKTIKFGPVRYFFSGGDALSDKTRMYFELLYRRKICNGYGLTETSPFVSVDIDDYTQNTNTIGKPFEQISLSVRDSENNELSQGSIGTLWIKGPNVMLGYYKNQEETNKVIKDGWFNSGDLAYIDNNGKIVLAGREKDLIKHKGIKIYPQEVENILLSHPEVIQAGVVGVIFDQEEYPVAYIASRTGNQERLILELRDLCSRNLANFKIPRQFFIKSELPITATGKIDKKKLKDY